MITALSYVSAFTSLELLTFTMSFSFENEANNVTFNNRHVSKFEHIQIKRMFFKVVKVQNGEEKVGFII